MSSIRETLASQHLVRRLLVTLGIILAYRFAAAVPLPGVDQDLVTGLREAATQGGTLGVLDLFSGGALSQASILSLSVMPYVTATIVLQLVEGVVPQVAELKKQGEAGRRKLNIVTRTLAVIVATFQAIGVVAYLRSGAGTGTLDDLLPNLTLLGEVHAVAILVAGFLLLTWLAEVITRHGLGSGMGVLVLVALIATLPGQGMAVLAGAGAVAFTLLLTVAVLGIVGVVAFTLAERQLEVTQSKGAGRRRSAARSNLPLKVVHAGVVPAIFTTAILTLITSTAGLLPRSGTGGEVRAALETHLTDQGSWVYMVLFAALIMFFTYFYTAVTFNPLEVADDLKRHGSFLPGVRPGEETSRRLAWVVSRLAVGAGVLLAVIALLPSFAQAAFGVAQFPLGGVTLLIAVGAVLDTMKRIKVQSLLYDYDRLVEADQVDRELVDVRS